MTTVPRDALLAKPDVQETITKIRKLLLGILPDAAFVVHEETILALLEEAGRGALEARLEMIAGSFADQILVDGVLYKRHLEGTGAYHSLSGTLRVTRDTYRQARVHNGPTIVPLELVAGIVEGATPALGYNVAHGYGQHDMRLHGEALEAAHRIPPPRATLERLAKRIAESATVAAPHIEAYLRRGEKLPEGAHGISMGLDRGSVPMAELRPEDSPAKPAPKRCKPRVRVAPKPIDVNFRMAYVGTVSITDAAGNALATRRYAAPASDDPTKLVSSMTADVRAALRCCPTLHVGTVQDGAHEMWSLTRGGLQTLVDDGLLDGWEEGIDRYHLLERLGKALEVAGVDATERKRLLTTWNEQLDTKDSAIDGIEQDLIRRYNDLSPYGQERLWEHLVYLKNNKDRMRYVTLALNGLPIGSGVTESAAKTLVGRRTKASGQRWSVPGLRGVLCLRGIHQSGRLQPFWRQLSRRYTREVKAA